MQPLVRNSSWFTFAVSASTAFLFIESVYARQWTDATGKFSVEAEFVAIDSNNVSLKKLDGTIIKVPLQKLSPVDQEYVRLRFAERTPNSINVVTSKDADERLFLIRLLEMLYEHWPRDAKDSKAFAVAISEHRLTAQRLQQHINDQRLGKELSDLYGDYVNALDVYSEFLVTIGKIESQVDSMATKDSFNSGVSAGLNGIAAYDWATNSGGMESGDAMGAAVIVGLVNLFADEYQKDSARETAKKAAIDRAAQRITGQLTSTLARAQKTSITLAQRYGWKRSEPGFENDAAETNRVLTLMEAGDRGALLRVAQAKVVSRPRDPFVRVSRNVLASLNSELKSSEVLAQAKDAVEAANLVPTGAIYDDYRGLCLLVGGLLANEARAREIKAAVDPLGSTEISRYAVALWNAVQRYDQIDATGEIREYRAWANMADNKLREAMGLAKEVSSLRHNDPIFCYQLACLGSRMADYDGSLHWLRRSIELGLTEIAQIKTDPDLAGLRANRNSKFVELITPKWSWRIDMGLFNDDILITNNSAFVLTNVTLNVRIEQPDKKWAPRLTVAAIAPGQTHKWENVISIPGGKVSSSNATLDCDQLK